MSCYHHPLCNKPPQNSMLYILGKFPQLEFSSLLLEFPYCTHFCLSSRGLVGVIIIHVAYCSLVHQDANNCRQFRAKDGVFTRIWMHSQLTTQSLGAIVPLSSGLPTKLWFDFSARGLTNSKRISAHCAASALKYDLSLGCLCVAERRLI